MTYVSPTTINSTVAWALRAHADKLNICYGNTGWAQVPTLRYWLNRFRTGSQRLVFQITPDLHRKIQRRRTLTFPCQRKQGIRNRWRHTRIR